MIAVKIHLLVMLLKYSKGMTFNTQVFDDSFAKAAPKYDAPKRKKRSSRQEKKQEKQEKQKQATRPMSTESGRGLIMVRPPSPDSSTAGTFGQGRKMKANPGMAMAMAQTGQQKALSQGFVGQGVEVMYSSYTM